MPAKSAARTASKPAARPAPQAAPKTAAKAAVKATAKPAGRHPHEAPTRDALGEVTETLEFMWSATQAVFGERATPDHAIALLPYALDALELRRVLTEGLERRSPSRRR